MGADDYAVVVGIQRYPAFGATPTQANDLKGPDRDAAAIEAWLTEPNGGAVPRENIRGIQSAAYPDPFPKGGAAPRKAEVMGAFRWLDGMARRRNDLFQGLTVGNRLYLYLSGHGFGRHRADGGLFMANATRLRSAYVEASRWAQWFFETTYFNEYVVWMDCCMNPMITIPPQIAGFRPVTPTKSPGVFSAFAARFPSLAVEARMGDGEIHGAFTWTLLKGLRGANADPVTGEVRSTHLHDYLTNSMRAFITPGQAADPNVSNEPDFGFTDDMLFATVPRPTFAVQVLFPAIATGAPWRVVTGAPPADVASGTITADGAVASLPAGVYICRVDSLGLLKGFEVSGAGLVVAVV